MVKKKLIVVWPYRFRDFDWQRFELDYLSQRVEVHVHELIDALTPEFAAAYANQSERAEVKRFSSLKEWRREFKAVSKNAIIFSHVRPTNIKSALICLTMRISGAKVIGFLLGGVVLPGSENRTLIFSLKSQLKRVYHFCRRNSLFLIMPNFVAVGGTEAEHHARRDYPRKTKPLLSCSFDYSQYLRATDLDMKHYDDAVYLDTGVPGFPSDFLLTGQTEILEPSQWYSNLGRFFAFVEESLKLQVAISAHPKHIGRDHSHLFGSREILSGKTCTAVAKRRLVISMFSTSIGFAVCFEKPLILVWSDAIELGVDTQRKSNIANFARETGATIFNIDREYTAQELRDALVIDHSKRESYKRKYLTSRTDDKPNYQVLLDEVINAAD